MRARGLLLLALAAAGPGTACSADDLRWRVEWKRQSTDRGTLDESTKWTLKAEHLPAEGAVSLLRLEVPLNDDDSDFEGSPTRVKLGDVKVRAGFRAVPVGERPVSSFVELTFPTAHPEERGTGKYQVSGGVRTSFPLGVHGGRRSALAAQVQQVVSFAGDADRKDVNQTKVEIEYRNDWPAGHFAKATFKPVYDWVGGGDGAVLEVEGGWAINRRLTFAAMVGGQLWGLGTPGTYGTRVEAKAIYRF